jgi:hypothetical protein
MSIRANKNITYTELMSFYNKYTYSGNISYSFDDIPLFTLMKIKKTQFIYRTGREDIIQNIIPEESSYKPSPPIILPEGTVLRSKLPSYTSIMSSESDFVRKLSEEMQSPPLEERKVSNLTKLPSPTELKMVKELDMKQVLDLIQVRDVSGESMISSDIRNKISSILGL